MYARKHLHIDDLLFLATLCLFGCSGSSPLPPPDNAHQAGIAYEFTVPPLFVDEKTELQHDVPVKNETGRPVQFSHVRNSCSCGKSSLEKKSLAPGEQTVLHFDIDLRNRRGPQRFTCWLVEDGGNEWSVSLQTAIYEREQFEPREVVHFGLDNPGAVKALETTFVLHRRRGEKVPQVSFQAQAKHLTLQPGQPQTEQLAGGIVRCTIPLRVELRFPSQTGLTESAIRAVLADAERPTRRQCLVTWSVQSPYRVTPSQVFFGRVERSSGTIERTVEIQRVDGQSLTIKGVTCSSPDVVCSQEADTEGRKVRLQFSLRTDSVRLPFAATADIKIDDSVTPVLQLPLAAVSAR